MTTPRYPNFTHNHPNYHHAGWMSYLQTRAAGMQEGWVWVKPDTKGDKKSIFVSPLYKEGQWGHAVTESVLKPDGKAEIIQTSYDAWGRDRGAAMTGLGTFGSKLAALPRRNFEVSPLEKILETSDTTNYLQFLNVYFQGLRQTMQPFTSPARFDLLQPNLLNQISHIEPPLLEGQCDTPLHKNAFELDNFFNRKENLYSPQVMQQNIAAQNDSTRTTLLAMLKNGISVYETMREKLCDNTSDIAKKARNIYGPETCLGIPVSAPRDKEMFKAWKALPDFAPAPKLNLA